MDSTNVIKPEITAITSIFGPISDSPSATVTSGGGPEGTLGSVLTEKISGKHLELGLVPFGSIGITLFTLDLYSHLRERHPETHVGWWRFALPEGAVNVLAMSRELGVQFAREGIRVNALCPGPVNTPLLQELFAKDPERAARRLVHIPMGRFAEASEIAGAVAFLASDDSSFITASNFLVDGGIAGAYVTPL